VTTPTIPDYSSIEIPKNPRVLCVAKRGKECWLLRFSCVWCGRTHTHGGGDGPEPDAGHRVSHCTDPWSPGGYELVVARVEP
jgi:hypothetical protein